MFSKHFTCRYKYPPEIAQTWANQDSCCLKRGTTGTRVDYIYLHYSSSVQYTGVLLWIGCIRLFYDLYCEPSKSFFNSPLSLHFFIFHAAGWSETNSDIPKCSCNNCWLFAFDEGCPPSLILFCQDHFFIMCSYWREYHNGWCTYWSLWKWQQSERQPLFQFSNAFLAKDITSYEKKLTCYSTLNTSLGEDTENQCSNLWKHTRAIAPTPTIGYAVQK